MNAAKLLARADRYLDSAQALIQLDDFESAVSRSYYAMYYAARAALRSRSIEVKSHTGLINAFGHAFVKTGVIPGEIGRSIRELFEARQFGEYADEFVFTQLDAERYLAQAHAFVEQVRGLLIS